ncbi:hypothetical protein M422DRAFT_254285 [Sphaerobolus stellatus SS14]|uniref:Uncharacterized protein n=1 Tax=Sphaerobolus stellatus (strain SS14) TaxID=990650 RepID=A0A0C9UHH6_SPHS4|nr:hypothetical protein M422DRAFT_254285 [Sphaerobolus stellatus SS14]
MNRVFLAAWLSDKEEQNLLAALGANSCTACLAETENLGEPKALWAHTSQDILKKIAQVKQKFDPTKELWDFIKECQNEHLSGVDQPFWADLPYTDICKVICNDTLHGLHKAFKDHTVQWNINCVTEIDTIVYEVSQRHLVSDIFLVEFPRLVNGQDGKQKIYSVSFFPF